MIYPQVSTLLSSLRLLRDDGKYCDVILYIGDKTVEAHKIVLAAWSPYFDSVLTDGEPGKEHLTVSCENHEDAFIQLVDFMYSGRATVNDCNVARLLSVADKFKVEPMTRLCEDFLKTSIHIKNFVTVFGLALRFRLKCVQENLAAFVQQNLSEAAKQLEFSSLSPSWILGFIGMESMAVLKPEYKVDLIVRWISADFENREKYLALLFSKMTWTDLSNDFLLEIRKSENFFTSNTDCLYLLLNSIYQAGLPLGPYTENFQLLLDQTKEACNRIQVDKVGEFTDDKPISAILLIKQVKKEEDDPNSSGAFGEDEYFPSEMDSSNLEEPGAERENMMHIDNYLQPSSESNSALKDSPGKRCRRSTRCKGMPTKILDTAENGASPPVLSSPKRRGKLQHSDEAESGTKFRIKRRRPVKFPKDEALVEKPPPEPERSVKRRGRPKKIKLGENGERETCLSGKFLKEDVPDDLQDHKPLSVCERSTWRKCDVQGCDFTATVIEAMEEHMVGVHEKEQTHCCNICDFRSSYQRIYLTHMKVHFSGPPFSCDRETCTYKTERIQPLLTHRMIHTDEKPYECVTCQAKFRSPIYLQVHERKHTAGLPLGPYTENFQLLRDQTKEACDRIQVDTVGELTDDKPISEILLIKQVKKEEDDPNSSGAFGEDEYFPSEMDSSYLEEPAAERENMMHIDNYLQPSSESNSALKDSPAGLPLGPYTENFQLLDQTKEACNRIQVDKVSELTDDKPISAILLIKQVKKEEDDPNSSGAFGEDEYFPSEMDSSNLEEPAAERENMMHIDNYLQPSSESNSALKDSPGKRCRKSTRCKGMPTKILDTAENGASPPVLSSPKRRGKLQHSDEVVSGTKFQRKRGRPVKLPKDEALVEKPPPEPERSVKRRGRPKKIKLGENGERETCLSGKFLKEDVPDDLQDHKPLSVRERSTWRKCDVQGCDFTATVIEAMEEHMVGVHEKEQTHCCNICDFRSSYQRIYLTHMKVHFSGPPFSCDRETCTYKTERIQPLLTHRMIHTDEKPYECVTCPAKFRSPIYLQVHERKHTAGLPLGPYTENFQLLLDQTKEACNRIQVDKVGEFTDDKPISAILLMKQVKKEEDDPNSSGDFGEDEYFPSEMDSSYLEEPAAERENMMHIDNYLQPSSESNSALKDSPAGLPLGPYTENFQLLDQTKEACNRIQVDKVSELTDDKPISAILLIKQVKKEEDDPNSSGAFGEDEYFPSEMDSSYLEEPAAERENMMHIDNYLQPSSESNSALKDSPGKRCRKSTRCKGMPTKILDTAENGASPPVLSSPKRRGKLQHSDEVVSGTKFQRKRGRPVKLPKDEALVEKPPPEPERSVKRRGRPKKIKLGENGERETCLSGKFLKEDVPDDLQDHKPLSVRERSTWRKCDVQGCAFTATVIEAMEEHMVGVHKKEKTHCCNICDFRSSCQRIYLTHMKVHFSGPPFSCDREACTYKTERIQPLLTHRMIHTDEKPYECVTCQAKFRSPIYLQVHERKHTGERPFECDICNRAFSRKDALDMHLISHTNSRPFLCETCGFAAKYQSDLNAHQRIHTGEVFRCQYSDCSFSTPKRSLIKAHLGSHLGIRGHACSTCGRAFVEKSQMVRHEKIHLEDKPFKCNSCAYSSTRRDKLKEHVSKHHSSDSPAPSMPYKPHKNRRSKEPLPARTLTDNAAILLEKMVESSSPSKSTGAVNYAEFASNIELLQQEQKQITLFIRADQQGKVSHDHQQEQNQEVLPHQHCPLLRDTLSRDLPPPDSGSSVLFQHHQALDRVGGDNLCSAEGQHVPHQGAEYSVLQNASQSNVSLAQGLEHLESPQVSVSILRGNNPLSQEAVAFVQSVADTVVLNTQPPVMSHNAQTTSMNNVTITTLEFIK